MMEVTFTGSALKYFYSTISKRVGRYENILKDLMLSRDQGVFIGVLLQLQERTQFIIARVETILSDVQSPGNETIVLHRRDIAGKAISENPIHLKNIKSIRVYKELQGVSH
jgi:hypothetical protein